MNALADPIHQAAEPHRPAIDGAVHIPLALLAPSPTNPRKHFDPAALQDLAASIKAHGQLHPILARPIAGAQPGRPLYEIVAGERRWRACQLADVGSIMAVVRPLTDFEVAELQLVENLKRADISPLEEADGYRRLLRTPDGLQGYATVDELAARVGKSPSAVRQRLKLLQLGDAARQALADGKITVTVALQLAGLPNADDQARATADIVRGWGGEPFTARAAADYIHRTYHLDLARAPFAVDDGALLPAAGACSACPKRTSAHPDLFEGARTGDHCTDGACWRSKEDAHRARIKADAEARGLQVLDGKQAKRALPDLLELDDTHPKLGDQPLRQLLGKADVTPVLVEHPTSKRLVEMVPQKEALAALKDAGVLKAARMPAAPPAQQQAQRDAATRGQRETAWRTAVAEACLEAVRGDAGHASAYRQALVRQAGVLLWHELHNDTRQRLQRLLGWPPLRGRWGDGPGPTANEHITALPDTELLRYLTAAVIASDVQVGPLPEGTPPRKPLALLATAEALGVDVAACKASVRKLQRATPDKAAADRKRKTAAQPTPETALAAAVKAAKPLKPAKVPVKYRDPATGMTWSGRGLQPRWLKAAIEGGARLDDFLAGAAPAKPASAVTDAGADPFRNDQD